MRRLLIVSLIIVFTGTLGAQMFSIRGTVKDESGAVIPGVQMTAEHRATGARWNAVTNDRGEFVIPAAAGEIVLKAALPGFRTTETIVSVDSAPVIGISIVLKVASATETVEVQVQALPLNAQMSIGSRGQGQGRIDRHPRPMHTESYSHIDENPFIRVSDDPRSTFAIDVDTASFANVRRFLNSNEMPPKDAVRIEELVNYFPFRYAPPEGPEPIAVHTEVGIPFWAPDHRVLKIALRAKDIDLSTRKPANLVFLIDVSGSMYEPLKLPLVKKSLHLLVDQLRADDRIAMVVYAGTSGLVLPSTAGSRKDVIHNAIESLEAGGSTNGGEGIQLAYSVAAQNYISGGINRVILSTDGDFNVGITSEGDLVRTIQQKAQSGVFLSVLGFGVGNYKDSMLEKLADKGHGNYAYVDSFQEAKKVLAEQMAGTLLTVAKDVKLQLEFNPSEVTAYRLIGYENRLLQHADFDSDSKQGGDVGAGLSVTALYELIPAGTGYGGPGAGPLKYQQPPRSRNTKKGELLTVSLRYKQPEGTRSTKAEIPVQATSTPFEKTTSDFRFASAVAAFGMLLRDSPNKGTATFDSTLGVAEDAVSADSSEYRLQFLELIRKARALASVASLP